MSRRVSCRPLAALASVAALLALPAAAQATPVTEFSTGLTVANAPADITTGPDGNLWFTEQGLLPGGVSHRFPHTYKDSWTIDDAVAELEAQRGRHFDPALVDAFLALVPDLEPDLLQQDSADARGDDQGDPDVGVLTLGQSTPAGATERIHSRKTESPTRA